jgi:hypothetical protein
MGVLYPRQSMYESRLYTEPKIASFDCLQIYNSEKAQEAHSFLPVL